MQSIDAAVSPQLAAVNRILRYVRQGQVISVASLREIDAEAIEFVVEPNARILGKTLEQIQFPRDAIIGAIVRADQVLVPTGKTTVQVADQAIVFSLPEAIPAVEKLFVRR
jgi:trk system potassium uptake protein TrkA